MSTSALWSWRSQGGRSEAFSIADGAALERDFLLHVFWVRSLPLCLSIALSRPLSVAPISVAL